MNSKGLPPEKEFDCPTWKIASFDPNDPRRRSETFDQTNEVPVRADQSGNLPSSRPLEDEWIGRAGESVIVKRFPNPGECQRAFESVWARGSRF